MKGSILLAFLPLAFALGMPGGYSDRRLDDVEVVEASSFLTSQLDASSGYTLKLVKAQSQVVAGVNYKLTYEKTNTATNQVSHCEVVVFIQSWTNTKEVSKNTCNHGAKRSLLGGNEPASMSDPQVAAAMDFGVDALNAMRNGMFRLGAVKVQNVQKQVVSGMLYKFTVKMAETTCRNSPENNGKDLTDCPVSSTAQQQECHFEVWYQSWMTPQYKLLNDKVSCQ